MAHSPVERGADEDDQDGRPAQSVGARAPATAHTSDPDTGAAPAPVILPTPSPITNGTGDLDPGPAVISGGGRTP
jgi:hypothetical protein